MLRSLEEEEKVAQPGFIRAFSRDGAMRLASGDWIFGSDIREVTRKEPPCLSRPRLLTCWSFCFAGARKMVSKSDIHEHLWPGTFVSPANLANLVGDRTFGCAISRR